MLFWGIGSNPIPFFGYIMKIIKNPNPIQFTEEESQEIDQITQDYIKIIKKMAKSKAKGDIGSKKVKTWNIDILRFGDAKPTSYNVELKTTTKEKVPLVLWSVWKGKHDRGKRTITLWSSGNVRKKDVGDAFLSSERLRREEINASLTTLLHEMAHAKDPIGFGGTSGLQKRMKGVSDKVSGWKLYVNDAERKEIRAHLVEWENFVKDIADKVSLNPTGDRDKPYSNAVMQLYDIFIDPKYKNMFTRYLKNMLPSSYDSDIAVPRYLSEKFIAYEKFTELEDEALDRYIDYYVDKYKRKGLKPSKRQIEQWKKLRENNYTDMVNAIYKMFVDYGLVSPMTYIEWLNEFKSSDELQKQKRRDYLSLMRARMLFKRDKIVLSSLMERFKDLS